MIKYFNYCEELYDKNAQAQGDPSSLLLLDEKEQFVEKLDSILKQIEIFEKGFQEFIKEKEDISKDSHDLVEEKEFDKNDKKKMDFSDINEVFARVVSKTLSNENYENFLKILQQLCLIPSNEQGKNIWTTLNSSLQNINGTKQGFYLFIFFFLFFLLI